MEKHKILIIDDDENILLTLQVRVESWGYEVITASEASSGIELALMKDVDVALLDLKLPGVDGMEALRQIKNTSPDIEIIMLTAHGSIESAVAAIKKGAYDYVTKPIDTQRLRISIERALEKGEITRKVTTLRKQLYQLGGFEKIIGISKPMREVYRLVEQVAPTNATVLITGESGTGKELVARTIHELSPRRKQPFIAINCSAIPQTLWESEIFGFEKGSFTGAHTRRKGYFELAHQGTFFLDEVADITLDHQAKFLRVLEEKKVRRLGGNEETLVDVRLVGATNRNLQEAIEKGLFREDLFYRLNVFTISLPPLRERKEDIPLMVHAFVEDFSSKNGRAVRSLHPDVNKILQEYTWPGNVRELRNVIERAVILCQTDELMPHHLPPHVRTKDLPKPHLSLPMGLPLEKAEEKVILGTLQFAGGNKSRAAELLKISLKTLYNKLKKYTPDSGPGVP